MIYFNNDYSEGCHPRILEALTQTNMDQTPGYGMDAYCDSAREQIRGLCHAPEAAVHFLVGGTQVNLTVISAALRPHQAVIGACSAHIHVHETGAIEATGHKVIALPSPDGKLTAQQIKDTAEGHLLDSTKEHIAQPKMVYLSNPTELGTIYSRSELMHISLVCRKYGLYLFMDGARLGYGLTAADNDLSLADIASCCDVFYIGGTKVGALFGEAVVITNPAIAEDFRYIIKQKGGMLAKGRLLGIQFRTLMDDGLYFEISGRANRLADMIRNTLSELGIDLLIPGTTNQVFPILTDRMLEKLSFEFAYSEQERVDENHRAVRFCTSWATREEDVIALCNFLKNNRDLIS